MATPTCGILTGACNVLVEWEKAGVFSSDHRGLTLWAIVPKRGYYFRSFRCSTVNPNFRSCLAAFTWRFPYRGSKLSTKADNQFVRLDRNRIPWKFFMK